jgi:hypothetical protein
MKKKSQLDKFYTKPEIAQECIDSITGEFDLWLEPSAGAGVFLHRLPKPRIGLDIEPDDEEILTQDFFQWKPPSDKRIAVIGNPPFGTNSKLAIQFFNHAAEWATLIAFIVPRTFRKVSVQNRLSLKWSLTQEKILPVKAFHLLDDNGDVHEHKVPCVWQIWERHPREKINLPVNHPDWEWVNREEANYAIRRVGGLAGKVIKDFESYATPSHYFITCSPEVLEKLDSLYEKFQEVAKDTAGNPSLGKGEMVRIYNEVH